MMPDVQRLAAFCDGATGGNPAGVMIAQAHPDEGDMQRIAAEVGYSETAFAHPAGDGYRVRYFSPASEVPFCGHATIALGAALATAHGDGVFALQLNDARISVEGRARDGRPWAALQSPPTRSAALETDLLDELLGLFAWRPEDLDSAIPPARIHAGADHIVLGLDTRARLAAMSYDFEAGCRLMRREGIITILLAFVETPRLFHARNAFAAGGVYEDPATGAAPAALGGYLRDLGWPHAGSIEIHQGEDMGAPSRLVAEIPPATGSSIRVSGHVRFIETGADANRHR